MDCISWSRCSIYSSTSTSLRSFVCNNDNIAAHVENWINSDCDTQPMCIKDVCTSDFYSLMMDIKEWKSEDMAYAAFPAEMAEEEAEEQDNQEIGKEEFSIKLKMKKMLDILWTNSKE